MGGMAFSFLNGGMLFAAALAPLLVLAYRRSRPSKRSIVSSVMLLRVLERRRPIKQRIKLPFRFFLELLALLLLAAAAAVPVLQSPTENIAVVIDNSLSMSAPAGDAIAGESRLDAAKRAASEIIKSAPLGSTFSVFSTSPHMTDLAVGPADAAAAAALVAGISFSPTPDQLRGSIISLGSTGQYDRIAVFSDHEAGSGEHLLAADGARQTIVSLNHVGQPAPNLFISDIHSVVDPTTQERTVTVSIASDAGRRAAAEVALSVDGKKAAPFAKQIVELEPRQASDLHFLVPRGFDPGTIIKAELTSLQGSATNTVAADDVGFAAGAGGKTNRVLLITSTPTPGDDRTYGLGSIGSLQITTIDPATAARLSADEFKAYSLIIFHRISLAAALPVPSLFILPPPGEGFFSGRPIDGTAAVTSWAEDHPITSYLRVTLLKLAGYSTIAVPSWASSVINVEQGSVLAAGESRGIRFAAAGFELLPYEGAKTPVTTVITLNLLKWLSGAKELAGSLLAGSSYQLEGDRSWVVRLPDGKLQSFVTTEGQGKELPFPVPGVYTVAGVSTDDASKVSKSVTRFVVNVRFPEESQTNQHSVVEIPSNFPRITAGETPGIDLWKPALWTVFALLLLETLLFFLPRPQEA